MRIRLHSHGNMDELYQVTNKPHDSETDRDSLGNLDKFYASKQHMNRCTGVTKDQIKDLFERVLCIEQGTMKGTEGETWSCDCRMTNLISLADKLLRYVEELLEFFGHYAEGRMNDERQKNEKVCCVGRKQSKVLMCPSGPLNSLTLSLAGTHACSH
jgi:hypothetical protein